MFRNSEEWMFSCQVRNQSVEKGSWPLEGDLAVAAGAAAVPGSAAAVATEVLMRVSRKAQISKEDDDPAAAGPPQGGWGPLWGAATTRSEGAWGLTGSRPSSRP